VPGRGGDAHLHHSRNAEACRRTAAELSLRGHCEALPADVSVAHECARLAVELSGGVRWISRLTMRA
jgi:hypothetical protein